MQVLIAVLNKLCELLTQKRILQVRNVSKTNSYTGGIKEEEKVLEEGEKSKR